ncbi:MAG: hypothetical protein AB1486_14010 [Planctomycetota bacterium]
MRMPAGALHMLPTSLKIVAALLVFEGLCSATGIIVHAAQGHLRIDLMVFVLPLGLGLLRLSPTCRRFALALLWLQLVSCPVMLILLLAASKGPMDYWLLSFIPFSGPKGVGIVMATAYFLLSAWQISVLLRPEVKGLFGVRSDCAGTRQDQTV